MFYCVDGRRVAIAFSQRGLGTAPDGHPARRDPRAMARTSIPGHDRLSRVAGRAQREQARRDNRDKPNQITAPTKTNLQQVSNLTLKAPDSVTIHEPSIEAQIHLVNKSRYTGGLLKVWSIRRSSRICTGKPHVWFDEGGLVMVSIDQPLRHRRTKVTETDRSTPSDAGIRSLLFPVDGHERTNRVPNRNSISIAWVIRKSVTEYLKKCSPLFRKLSQ